MIIEPRCSKRRCKHYMGVGGPEDTEIGEVPICKAYPKGIPEDIAYGEELHTEPMPGDHGIQFEKAKTVFDMAVFQEE